SPVNDPPVLLTPIPDLNASEDQLFTFQFVADTFSDVDGDLLGYSTSTLPAWLHLDPPTRTFSGTPSNSDVGSFSVTLTATDPSSAFADVTFQITVANMNDAPTLNTTIPDQNATEDAAFNFQFAANTFSDVDAGDS